ncbi:MAG TPA: AlkA N-terminal domain-containing protein [Kofleriaceae bacterium]
MDDDARYRALTTHDRRFDGVFFVGVSTTGIYCRPICPARTPRRDRVTFYATAAQAEAAGYRACLRCRPEVAPRDIAEVDAVDTLVATALRRIHEGALNERSVETLAAELGVSARHLRRATEARLGVTPVDLAQSRRLALAKQLLHDTRLSLSQIAFAAGFGSVRRFNAVFRARTGKAPSEIRRSVTAEAGAVVLRLDYRPPYAWAELLAFLRARAIPGVEAVSETSYARVVHVGGATGTLVVTHLPARHAIEVALSPQLLGALMPLVARVRRAFDLDARPDVIAAALSDDPLLASRVAARPGLRVPGAIDGFEAAVRALLGQQVSVAAATTLAGRFAAAFGTPYIDRSGFAGPRSVAEGRCGADDATYPELRVRFPTAAEVARVRPGDIAAIGMPGARGAAIHALATAVAAGTIALDGVDLDAFVSAIVALPGIGPWTAHYLAMRALHLPDAFPAADLGVLKALGGTPRDAEARAAAWRPFRAYAVIHLWTGGAHASEAGNLDARRADDPRVGRSRAGARRADPAGSRAARGPRRRRAA